MIKIAEMVLEESKGWKPAQVKKYLVALGKYEDGMLYVDKKKIIIEHMLDIMFEKRMGEIAGLDIRKRRTLTAIEIAVIYLGIERIMYVSEDDECRKIYNLLRQPTRISYVIKLIKRDNELYSDVIDKYL